MKTKALFLALFLVTVLRGIWVWTHEVAPAEAYYWMCSQRLAPGFFDGPSGTALLVRAFGESFDFARLFWPVLAFLGSWAAWIFIRRIYDESTAAWGVVLLNALPLFNRSAVEVGPLMPALTLTLAGLVLARMAWSGRRWAWVGAGVFFSAGLLFRFEVALVPAGILAAAVASPRRRADRPGLAAVVVLCGVALWPALAWNASLEWVPIAGGTWRSAWEFRLDRFLTSLARLSRAFSLPVVVLIFPGVVFLARAARLHARAGFLAAACGFAWAWSLYCLVRGGDATVAGALGFVPLCAFVAASSAKFRPAPFVGWAIVAAASVASVFSFSSGGSWKEMAGEFHAAARDLPAAEKSGFFIAEDPTLAAVLGYYIPGESAYPSVFIPESPDLSSQFGLWPSYADFLESPLVSDPLFTEQKGANPFIGRNAVYIGQELPQTIKGAFAEVTPLKTLPGPDGKNLVIYLCLGYQTLPL